MATERSCFCPDDCSCHYPWRATLCGCRSHDEMCHNGHAFAPGVSTDHAAGESDPRWCNTCGEARV